MYSEAKQQLADDPKAKSFAVLGKPKPNQFAYRVFPESYAKKFYWVATYDSEEDFNSTDATKTLSLNLPLTMTPRPSAKRSGNTPVY